MRHRLTGIAAAVCLAAGLSGCAHAHAKAPSDTPPLAVPAPPPRNVEPAGAEAPPPMALPEEPARHTPSTGGTAPRREPPRTEKPEAKPEPPPEPPKPAEEPPKPATTLQTTPTGAEGAVERSIRVVLNRASGDLSHIDYRVLNADARTQYDTAKRFIAQAEEAMRAKNLVFAKNLADKAAALAAQLAGK
jgi:hypothetical protein